MAERFKVDLRGIIDLAANHMYTSSEVFIREVIQNAFDAITARRQLDDGHVGSIQLDLTPGADGSPSTLCISDDGIGLTETEVHEFLSTVGGSSKREDAEQMAEAESGFLGRFGIGLLSCFMVSDEIVAVTRSARASDAPAIEWRGRADGSYTVRTLASNAIQAGTRVYLTAKEDLQDLFVRDTLIDLARKYAEMLPVQIVVRAGGDEVQVTRPRPPWQLDQHDSVALNDECQHSLGFNPIDAFPVSSSAGGVEGYAFIRPARTSSWGARHRLYANGMFVCENGSGLVPTWATFIGCVLNATSLRLTASRESVQHNKDLDAATEQVGACIRARLAHLLRNDRGRFETVLQVHDTEIRGYAIKDSDFFDVIIDLLEFDTTLGPIRFGEYRREHERILIARTSEQYRRVSIVAQAMGLRVFNGGYTYHEELLSRAAQKFPELQLQSFDSADVVQEWAAPDDAEQFAGLVDSGCAALAGRDCTVVVKCFAPAEIPAFFALGLDIEFHRQLDRTKSMASGLWGQILDAMAPRPETAAPTQLCLNADNALIRQLASIHDEALRRTAVEILYVQALMSGQHPLLGDEHALLNAGLLNLLQRISGRSSSQ